MLRKLKQKCLKRKYMRLWQEGKFIISFKNSELKDKVKKMAILRDCNTNSGNYYICMLLKNESH